MIRVALRRSRRDPFSLSLAERLPLLWRLRRLRCLLHERWEGLR